jgi:DNA-binding MarR family transcriptional regulator
MNVKKQQSAVPPSPLTGFMMMMSSHLLVAMARSLRTEQLSLAEMGAIQMLGRGRSLRVNEIADGLLQPLPAASRIISGLVDRGLVERREDPDDRRAKMLTLTAKGRTMLDALGRQLVDEVGAALAGMDGTVSATMKPIYQMLRAQEAAGDERPPGTDTERPVKSKP